MRALPTPSVNDGSGFHTNIPISELIEHDTRAVEASIVSLAPPIAKTKDGVMHETWPTPIRPQGARGLELPDPRSRDQGSKAGPRRARGCLTSNKKVEMILSASKRIGQRPLGLICVFSPGSVRHEAASGHSRAGLRTPIR